MRRKFALLLLAAIASAMLVPASALAHGEEDDPNACSGEIGGMHAAHNTPAGAVGVPQVSRSIVVPLTDARTGPFYLDVRDLASDHYSFSIWLYQETNRTAGLQRGGRAIFPDTPGTSGDDPCEQATNHDQAIF